MIYYMIIALTFLYFIGLIILKKRASWYYQREIKNAEKKHGHHLQEIKTEYKLVDAFFITDMVFAVTLALFYAMETNMATRAIYPKEMTVLYYIMGTVSAIALLSLFILVFTIVFKHKRLEF